MEEVEERISGMHGVLDYAGCFAEAAGSVDRINGWEAGLHEGFRSRPFVASCGLGQSSSHTKL